MGTTDDKLKVWDLIVKGVFGAALTAAVMMYGYRMQDEQQKVREQNSQLQAAIELTSKQKDLDVELGMRLFGTLMERYFKGTPSTDRNQEMLLLRLTALNFYDVPVNLKPLFEQLHTKLRSAEEKNKLRAIAQEVARRQAFRLTSDSGFDSGPQRVKAGDTLDYPNILTKIKIREVTEAGVKVEIVYLPKEDRPIGPFTVSYYDMPIVDNTKFGEYRVALILREVNGKEATIQFIAFPKHLAADRFDIKDISRAFRDRVFN